MDSSDCSPAVSSKCQVAIGLCPIQVFDQQAIIQKIKFEILQPMGNDFNEKTPSKTLRVSRTNQLETRSESKGANYCMKFFNRN